MSAKQATPVRLSWHSPTMLTSQPKFLTSIGYQICLAMVLPWHASMRALLKLNLQS